MKAALIIEAEVQVQDLNKKNGEVQDLDLNRTEGNRDLKPENQKRKKKKKKIEITETIRDTKKKSRKKIKKTKEIMKKMEVKSKNTNLTFLKELLQKIMLN